MKINLKPKTKRIFRVIIDEKTWGILPVKILQVFDISIDKEMEISSKKSQEIIIEITSYNWHKLLDYLAYRERSELECRQYLLSNYLCNDIIEQLIEKAKKLNYLNNFRFSQLYIDSLIEKNKSQREIKEKLRVKGVISGDSIEYLNEKYELLKSDIIKYNLDKLKRKYYGLNLKDKRKKMLSYMSNRGFNYYDVIDYLDGEVDDYEN